MDQFFSVVFLLFGYDWGIFCKTAITVVKHWMEYMLAFNCFECSALPDTSLWNKYRISVQDELSIENVPTITTNKSKKF